MRHELRVFFGEGLAAATPAPEVTVTLGEILDVLQDAVDSHRAWLRDFADDPVRISPDLYDVLNTCRQLRSGA